MVVMRIQTDLNQYCENRIRFTCNDIQNVPENSDKRCPCGSCAFPIDIHQHLKENYTSYFFLLCSQSYPNIYSNHSDHLVTESKGQKIKYNEPSQERFLL